MNSSKVIIFFAGVILLSICTASAQHAVTELQAKRVSYYTDMRVSPSSEITEISNGQLNLQYNDLHGNAESLPLKIYNWKRELVAQVNLNKVYGLNYYTIPLPQLSGQWANEKLYTCELINEGLQKYEVLFKLKGLPDNEDLKVDILVSPLSINCGEPSLSAIEFYGQVTGGKAPYQVRWYVTDHSQTNLLYQPLETVLRKAGKTSVITVDASPGYFVLMKVKDACGQEGQQMVRLVCQENQNIVNTIFVQPIYQMPSKSKN